MAIEKTGVAPPGYNSYSGVPYLDSIVSSTSHELTLATTTGNIWFKESLQLQNVQKLFRKGQAQTIPETRSIDSFSHEIYGL